MLDIKLDKLSTTSNTSPKPPQPKLKINHLHTNQDHIKNKLSPQ